MGDLNTSTRSVKVIPFEAWHVKLIHNPRNDAACFAFGADMDTLRACEQDGRCASVFLGNRLLGCGGIIRSEGLDWLWMLCDEEASRYPILLHKVCLRGIAQAQAPAALVSSGDTRAMRWIKRFGFRGSALVSVHPEVPKYIKYARR
jgi:hypothetical protein